MRWVVAAGLTMMAGMAAAVPPAPPASGEVAATAQAAGTPSILSPPAGPAQRPATADAGAAGESRPIPEPLRCNAADGTMPPVSDGHGGWTCPDTASRTLSPR